MLLEPSEGDLANEDLLSLQNRLNELHKYGDYHLNLGGIKFRVTQSTEASDPNLPSTFFPGSGTDRFTFEIITWHRPTEDQIRQLIESNYVDYYLTGYDPATGIGRVACLDCYALKQGSEHQLTEPVNWQSAQAFNPNQEDWFDRPDLDVELPVGDSWHRPSAGDAEVEYEMPRLSDGSPIPEMKL